MKKIIAGCYQFDVRSGDVDRNLASVEEAVGEFAKDGCRLLVLPEMWSSGFAYPRLKSMAENTPAILESLKAWGSRYGMVLVGSLPEAESGRIFNTSYVIDASGKIAGKYRKMHLFSLHNEHLHFGRGETALVCSTEAGRVGVMICYDLRFPELARRLALDGAEILCISALWPKARVDHWSLLLRGRALENQCFVVGCNGCGREEQMEFGGSSAVVSPTATVLAQADDRESRIVALLNPEEMAAFRKQIPCFPDRLPDAYKMD